MRRKLFDKCISVDLSAAMSLALSKYHFSTADIREIIHYVLGHAPSERGVCRLARSDGSKRKRGRPPTIPKIKRRDLHDLIVATSWDPQIFDGNMLHFLHYIELQFGLSPHQYLSWVTRFVRHGKYMMRCCFLCGDLFPSVGSGDRRCRSCRVNSQRTLRRYDNSISVGLEGMTMQEVTDSSPAAANAHDL
ncbi:MAG: hypothetical protein O6948_09860 [Deltaproteobacteria bacterium]|nr:hypothetical protein [Deltaproteobacteria bacterium]